jgi:hypothetical protein
MSSPHDVYIRHSPGTKVQALIDGEPFTSFNDGDYWDAEGFHEGKETVYIVNFESEEIARNFFAAYLIGLASTQEAESWKPIHLKSEEDRLGNYEPGQPTYDIAEAAANGSRWQGEEV